MLTASPRSYPEGDQFRADLCTVISALRYRHKVRGDELIARHDAEAGKAASQVIRMDLAEAVATIHDGPPEELYRSVRDRVPSAKPSRMRGMNSQDDRSALRGDNISHWGEDRLLAVLASLGYRARLVVERIESPPSAAG